MLIEWESLKKGYIMPFFKPKVILKFTFRDFEVLRGCLFDGQSGSYFPTFFSQG